MSGSSESESEHEIRPFLRPEENVNRRAGHIAVVYGNGVLVWGGYAEVETFSEGQEYWPPGDIWHYSNYTNTWRKLVTTGDVPNRCSGSAACVIDDHLYVVAGFHQVFSNSRRDHTSESDEDLSDSEDEYYDRSRIVISNRMWRLNLRSLVWEHLAPGGVLPLACDKTSLSAVSGQAVLFGGYGPPPSNAAHASVESKFEYQHDFSTESYYGRGWSNQLVCFHSDTNKWEWPTTHGTAPSPRAAHSSAEIRDKIYIFGGRHEDQRLNDLHCLDTKTMTWSNLMLPSDSPPIGRSWQSLTPLHAGETCRKDYLILYGGFDNELKALSDCWKLDLSADVLSWERQTQLELGPRLWHASVAANQSTIMIIGGITNNILAPSYVTKLHAEKVLFLQISPKSLLEVSLDYISGQTDLYKDQFVNLPLSLRGILEVRCKIEPAAAL